MDQQLTSDLERFVREQAARYGDVISYVPEPKAAEVAKKSTAVFPDVAVADVSLEGIEAKLGPHKDEPWFNAKTLDELNAKISDCKKCPLWETRTKFVFGVGNPNAKLMIIGEAPGADEDEQGEPFVGRAGQLLNKMLVAINFQREEVFIANVLKSRPPNNRDPKPEEVAACEPYLFKQIALIKPKFILCLGRIAGQNLLKTNDTLGKMRGQVFDFNGIQTIVTYHPAALLRNPDWKHGAWEDLQKLRRMYDEVA